MLSSSALSRAVTKYTFTDHVSCATSRLLTIRSGITSVKCAKRHSPKKYISRSTCIYTLVRHLTIAMFLAATRDSCKSLDLFLISDLTTASTRIDLKDGPLIVRTWTDRASESANRNLSINSPKQVTIEVSIARTSRTWRPLLISKCFRSKSVKI